MTGQVPGGWERRVRADLAASEADDARRRLIADLLGVPGDGGWRFLRIPPLSAGDREALRRQVLDDPDPGGFYAVLAAAEQAQERSAADAVWSELVHGCPAGEADAGSAADPGQSAAGDGDTR